MQEMKEDVYCSMRIIVVMLAISSLLLSCGDGQSDVAVSDSSADSPVRIVQGDTSKELLHGSIGNDSFLLSIFTARVDSFFTQFAGGELTVSSKLRSFTQRDTFTNVRYILLPVNGSTTLQYDFESGAGNPTLTFTVYEARYHSETDVQVAWEEFQRLSGMPGDTATDDRFPCISYCNDYAFRTGTKIFWLSTDCGYGMDTFRTLQFLLKQSVWECSVIDTIKCNRGDGLPRNHN